MRKLSLLLLLILLLVLSLGEAIAQGANASPLPGIPGQAIAQTANASPLPVLVTAAADKVPLTVAIGDGNSEISAAVIEQLRQSGKFDIFVFSADLPTITRAIMERKISADAVKNPASAEKAVLIARALSADYAVLIQGSVDGSKAKVTLGLLKVPEGRWTTTAESEISGSEGPRAAMNRNNAISTAVSSAVSQILIEAFGGLPEPEPVVAAPKVVETQVIAPEAPPKTAQAEPARDVTSEYNAIIRQVDSYAAKGDLRNAVIELKHAVNLEPDKPPARVRLAQMYADLGMNAQAIDECRRALLFDKDSVPVYSLLAKQYIANGSLAEAADQCAQVIRLDPKNVEARLGLGDISWNLAKIDDAVAAYEGAVNADPTNPMPHERLQRLYVAKKMYPEAIDHLVQAKVLGANATGDPPKKYGVIAQIIQDEFNLVTGKLDSAKNDYDNDKIAREEYYADCKDAATRIDALATFISNQTAPKAYKDIHPRSVLATSLLAQAGGYIVSYLETEQEHYQEQADLLRDEAKTEMNDFVTGLKTAAGNQHAVVSPKEGNG